MRKGNMVRCFLTVAGLAVATTLVFAATATLPPKHGGKLLGGAYGEDDKNGELEERRGVTANT